MKHVIALVLLLMATAASAQPELTVTVTLPVPSANWSFTGMSTDPVLVSLESGMPVAFSWSTDVWSEFRIGWDLLDPGDPFDPGWTAPGFDPLLTSATRTFTAGVHMFTVDARDAEGGLTRGQFIVQVIPVVPVQADSWSGVLLRYR